MSRRGVDSGALGGNGELGFKICPGALFPADPQPYALNLLADEGSEGLHLQGGAHDDEEVHLGEVLQGTARKDLDPTARTLCPASTPAQQAAQVGRAQGGHLLTACRRRSAAEDSHRKTRCLG